jgi:hypothetical protein
MLHEKKDRAGRCARHPIAAVDREKDARLEFHSKDLCNGRKWNRKVTSDSSEDEWTYRSETSLGRQSVWVDDRKLHSMAAEKLLENGSLQHSKTHGGYWKCDITEPAKKLSAFCGTLRSIAALTYF